jgi:hypothetical protein
MSEINKTTRPEFTPREGGLSLTAHLVRDPRNRYNIQKFTSILMRKGKIEKKIKT